MADKIVWHEETRRVSELSDHSQNPRLFTEKGMRELDASLEEIGYAQPINVSIGGTILSGHARKKKLLEKGFDTIPVWVPNRELTAEEERKVLLRMNKNQAGEFDFEILANEFEIAEMKDVGFTDFDLGIQSAELEAQELTERDSPLAKTWTFVFEQSEYEQVERAIRDARNAYSDENGRAGAMMARICEAFRP